MYFGFPHDQITVGKETEAGEGFSLGFSRVSKVSVCKSGNYFERSTALIGHVERLSCRGRVPGEVQGLFLSEPEVGNGSFKPESVEIIGCMHVAAQLSHGEANVPTPPPATPPPHPPLSMSAILRARPRQNQAAWAKPPKDRTDENKR